MRKVRRRVKKRRRKEKMRESQMMRMEYGRQIQSKRKAGQSLWKRKSKMSGGPEERKIWTRPKERDECGLPSPSVGEASISYFS